MNENQTQDNILSLDNSDSKKQILKKEREQTPNSKIKS